MTLVNNHLFKVYKLRVDTLDKTWVFLFYRIELGENEVFFVDVWDFEVMQNSLVVIMLYGIWQTLAVETWKYNCLLLNQSF